MRAGSARNGSDFGHGANREAARTKAAEIRYGSIKAAPAQTAIQAGHNLK
jgi:hypothetical protein